MNKSKNSSGIKETRVTTNKGFDVILYPNNYIDQVVLKEGFYESEVLEALLEGSDDKTIFWDIGSNIGLHSLGFKYHNPQSVVYSFEPDFINFFRLYQNSLINNLDLELMNFPLSDRLECSKIFRAYGNHGRSTLYPHGKGGYVEKQNFVFAVTGDYLIFNELARAPNVVKIDVEGYETQVVKGLIETIKEKKINKIVFEAPQAFLQEKSELQEILTHEGYRFEVLTRNEATHHNLENFVAYL